MVGRIATGEIEDDADASKDHHREGRGDHGNPVVAGGYRRIEANRPQPGKRGPYKKGAKTA